MPNDKHLKYDPTVRQADTDRARTTITPTLIPTEAKPIAIDFVGQCPRCDHDTASRKALIAVAASLKMSDAQREKLIERLDELGVDLSIGDETFDLTCDCTGKHGGQPDGVRGCGARFRVRVSWP